MLKKRQHDDLNSNSSRTQAFINAAKGALLLALGKSLCDQAGRPVFCELDKLKVYALGCAASSCRTRLCVLFSPPFAGIVCAIMRGLSFKSLCTLLLAAGVAFAVSVSAVQSSGMAAKVAISAEMSGPAQDGCDGCPDGDQDSGATCISLCIATGFAVLPALATPKVLQTTDSALPVHTSLRGRFSSPEPYPPKPSDLS